MGTIIEMDLPPWAESFSLYFLAGVELLGYKFPGDPFYIKTVRCNQCGECCEGLNPGALPSYMSVVDGKCSSLIKHGNQMECQLQLHSSYTCVTGLPRDVNGDIAAYCNMAYEEV